MKNEKSTVDFTTNNLLKMTNNITEVKMRSIIILSLITISGCSVFLPYSEKSYDTSEESSVIEVSELNDKKDIRNPDENIAAYNYLKSLIDPIKTAKEQSNGAINTLLENYRKKYSKKIEELCQNKKLNELLSDSEQENYCLTKHALPLAAPIISGMASLASDQLIKQISKSFQADQERHSYTYIASKVDPYLLLENNTSGDKKYKQPNDEIYRTIHIKRKSENYPTEENTASHIKLGYTLIGYFKDGTYEKLEDFSKKYVDELLAQKVPAQLSDIQSYKKKLDENFKTLEGLAKISYSGILTPISLQMNSSAAKIYSTRIWSWLFPPFWYQIFFDQDIFKDDVKVSGKLLISNAELKFDLPSYNLTTSETKKYCNQAHCLSSYPMDLIAYTPNPRIESSVTESDPAEIKAIGDTFNDIAPKVRKEALDMLEEKLKQL